jgi:hypothetical protein
VRAEIKREYYAGVGASWGRPELGARLGRVTRGEAERGAGPFGLQRPFKLFFCFNKKNKNTLWGKRKYQKNANEVPLDLL